MLDQNTDRSINTIGVILLAGAMMIALLAFMPDFISSLASTADGVDVIYELDGGSSTMDKRHLGIRGEHTIPLDEPTIDSYHFAGWENSTTGEIQFPGETFRPQQNTTMTATWRVRQHDIEYDANGGEGDYPLQRVDYYDTYTIYADEPVFDGHTFRGWHNDFTGGTNYPGQTITPEGDILFTANWQLNAYQVSYHLNGGSGSFSNTEIDHFDTFNISNTTPTRTGYTFTGWRVESDDPDVSTATRQPGQSIEITGRTRLTAQWTINSYNITYNLNGGVGTSTGSTNVYNTSYRVHTSAPTRVGYTFDGWKRSDTNTDVSAGATFAMPANNVTLTAQWRINKYNVTYAVNGGSGSYSTASVDYNVNHTISSTVPTRTGYTFQGWRRSDTNEIISQGSTFRMPANHVTLTAQWSINSYQVIYNLNGGSGSFSNNTLNYNSLYSVSGSTPTRTGYTFTGWKRSDTGAVIQAGSEFRIPANNVTLTAEWSINGYDITYDRNGGTSGPSGTTKHNFNSTFSVNSTTPARTGYSFNGWRRSDNNGVVQPGGSFTVPSRDVTLTAQWTINTQTVTYNLNGGSGSFPQATVNHGSNFTVSSSRPTRTHFTFANWTRSGSGSGTLNPGNSFTVTGNTTLTANWTRDTSTVSYNANGGSGAPGNQTKQHGITLSLSGSTPSRSGYTFQGWNTNSSGTGTNYSPGGNYTANSNVTLYARWTPNNYNVSYSRGSGATGGPSTTTGTYTRAFTVNKSSIPRLSGHVFSGWQNNRDGRYYNPGSSFTMPMQTVTLTARWRGSGFIQRGARIKIRAGATYVSNSVGEYGRTIPESHTIGRVSYVQQLGTHGSGSVVFGDTLNGNPTGAVHINDIIYQDPDITLR